MSAAAAAATSIGTMAATALQQPQHCSGQVLAVFDRSAYLISEHNQLICLGADGNNADNTAAALPPGPLHVLLDAILPVSQLKPGMRYQCHHGELLIGPWCRFSLQSARCWQPPPLSPGQPEVLQQNLRRLLTLLPDLPDAGLARLIRPLLQRQPLSIPDNNLFWQRSVAALNEIACWLTSRSQKTPPAAQQLLGLGPGLTPSGDDCLGGIMIALNATGKNRQAEQLWQLLNTSAHTATSCISYAHLCCAAAGAGSLPLHNLLNALYAASNEQALAQTLPDVLALGHSSGWDALSGIILVCTRISINQCRSE